METIVQNKILKAIDKALYETIFNLHNLGGKTKIRVSRNFDYVDMGNSVKWGTYNIGATCPEDPGLLFLGVSPNGYRYGDLNAKFLLFSNNLPEIYKKPIEDIAYIYSNGGLRTPTMQEFKELKELSDISNDKINGNNVLVFTSKINRKTLIFPLAGYYTPSADAFLNYNSIGIYWTTSISNKGIHQITYLSTMGMSFLDESHVYEGLSIRGILNI